MEKKYTLHPGLFLAYFIICIINFAFGLISAIVDWSVFSSAGLGNIGWIEILAIAICIGLIVYASLILAKTKDKENSGRNVLLYSSNAFISIYGVNLIMNIVWFCSPNRDVSVPTFIVVILMLATAITARCLLANGYSNVARIRLIVIGRIASVAEIVSLCMAGNSGAMSIIYLITSLIFTIFHVICCFRRKPAVLNVVPVIQPSEGSKEPSQLDKCELLSKYKDLLDKGAITEEEYEQKKKDLL